MALIGGDIAAFDISPDSRLLVTGAAYNDCTGLWDLHRRPPFLLTTLHNNHNDCGVTALRFSPDGTALLTGCNHGMVTIWDVATGVRVASVQHRARVMDVAFSRDGTLVASASCDTVVHLLKRESVECAGIIQGSESYGPGHGLEMQTEPLGSRFTHVAQRRTIHNSARGDTDFGLSAPAAPQLYFSNNGNRIYVADGPDCHLWDLAAAPSPSLPSHSNSTSKNDTAILKHIFSAYAFNASRCAVWTRRLSGSPLATEHATGTGTLAQDTDTLATADGRTPCARIWEMSTGRVLLTLDHAAVPAALLAPWERIWYKLNALTDSDDTNTDNNVIGNTIRVLCATSIDRAPDDRILVASFTVAAPRDTNRPVPPEALQALGGACALGEYDTIVCWSSSSTINGDATTIPTKLTCRWRVPLPSVQDLALSHSALYVAAAEDGRISIYDTSGGGRGGTCVARCVVAQPGAEYWVRRVCWTPDDAMVVFWSCGFAGEEIRVWAWRREIVDTVGAMELEQREMEARFSMCGV